MSDEQVDFKPSTSDLSIRLRPNYNQALGKVTDIEVSMTYHGLQHNLGQQILQMPLVFDNCETIAEKIIDLSVTDDFGAVDLVSRNLNDDGAEVKAWFSARPIIGKLMVEYRAPVSNNTGSRGGASPLELRNDSNAISGGASTFLLFPPQGAALLVDLKWDLHKFPNTAIAVSSLGLGDVKAKSPITLHQLLETYYMAGVLGAPADADENGTFFSAWQGVPPYDPAPYMKYSENLHRRYSEFFETPPGDSYGIMIRYNPVNGGGGRECHKSFLLTYNERSSNEPASLRSLISHEMFHTFSPMLGRPQAAGQNLAFVNRWFFEGLAVFYQCRFPWQAGLIDDLEYISDCNFHAARYYSSVMASLPNEALADSYWTDTRVRTLAYDRGMFYFATVNDELLLASNGTHSLDDVILELVRFERGGQSISDATWRDCLMRYLGTSGVSSFEAFLAGQIPLPRESAFGSRFTRTTKSVRRYELGFEPAVLSEPGRIIRGLIPGSAAEKAGLRDGDHIVYPVPQDRIQGSQDMLLNLTISRDAVTQTVSYLPRGEAVDVYQWVPLA